MKHTRSRYKSIDARTVILALIGLVFLGSGDMARGQGNPDPRIKVSLQTLPSPADPDLP